MREGEHRGDREHQERQSKIRLRAISDSFDYVALMHRRSPKSMQLNQKGELEINAALAKTILENARNELGLNPHEMAEYLHFLHDAALKFVKDKK